MQCLLAAATIKEITPFLESLKDKKNLSPGISIDVLITGIGLTASTYHLGKQLRLKHYDLIIQAGVAGCFDTNIPLGSVVVIKKDTIADQSVIELKQLKTLFDLKLVPANQYPYKKEWLQNPHKDWLKLTGLKQVAGISVNEITTSKQKIKYYETMFQPVAESMEGAALHYVCLMEQVPFIQIRSMSNYIGERNKTKWNMKDSIVRLNEALTDIIKLLKK